MAFKIARLHEVSFSPEADEFSPLKKQNIVDNVCGWFSLSRFTEKGNLEVLLFTIQSKMRANNQKVYMPREGKLISDINKVQDPSIRPALWAPASCRFSGALSGS